MLLLSLFFAHNAYSAARKFPHGCRTVGFGFAHGLLVLQSTNEDGPQTLYLIHNTAHEPIMMQQDKKKSEIFKSAYKNIIEPDEWAVFATDKNDLRMRCSTTFNEEEGHQVSCADLLELCQYNRAKFGPSNGGNYWVVPSEPVQKTAVRKTIKNGILLRW